jgi:pimeloyl-ACP methyl ester carboxylesterase
MGEPTVILLHGLWMTGAEMLVFRRRLRAQGFRVEQFHYRMVTRSLDHNCAQLKTFIGKHAPDGAHLIGHSLGGVLALKTLQQFPDLQVDKVICLGSPLLDSAAGRRLLRLPAGRAILGKTLPEAVMHYPLQSWSGRQRVGVIAGTRGVGLGRFVAALSKPNDGMVALAETCLPGIADHLALPVSHTGLVLSAQVVEQCGWFLRHGEFRRTL